MKSKGLGDSIEKLTKTTGIKTLVENIFADEIKTGKKDCGCDKRKDLWNKWLPYKNKGRCKKPCDK